MTRQAQSDPSMTPSSKAAIPPVMDYEGSGYRQEFWEGQGRNYEDAAERLALQRLLPPTGRRIAEVGAGFGRLADLYLGYEQIILFDYSRTLLREAVERWGHDPRFIFVAGNIYQLSLAKASLDTLVMVRVMHHLADVPQALQQLRRVLHGGSTAILEYANKRNLKAMARWLLRQQSWSPLDPTPMEFVKLNYDFHPAWMWEQFVRGRFAIDEQLAVSHFRTPLLKKIMPAGALATVDSWLFTVGGRYPLAPSVFVQVSVPDEPAPLPGVWPSTWQRSVVDLFCCPACGGDRTFVQVQDDHLTCQACKARYAKRDGIWDFKEPVE